VFSKALSTISDLVGIVKDWFQINNSEKLEDERIKVNSLVLELSDYNTSAQRRKELLDELNSRAPAVLKNINQEAISYETLKNNLEKYNQEMVRGFQLEAQKEEVIAAAKEEAKSSTKFNEAKLKLQQAIVKSDEGNAGTYLGADVMKIGHIKESSSLTTEQKARQILDLYKNNKASNSELENAYYAYTFEKRHLKNANVNTRVKSVYLRNMQKKFGAEGFGSETNTPPVDPKTYPLPIEKEIQLSKQVTIPVKKTEIYETNKIVKSKNNNQNNDQLDELYKTGQITYTLNDTMIVGRTTEVNLTISSNVDLKKIISEIETFNEENLNIDTILISENMRARLIDPSGDINFKIVRMTEEEQFLNEGEYTLWKWNVTPLNKGNNKLSISVDVIVNNKYYIYI
jgi:hypothetical protein